MKCPVGGVGGVNAIQTITCDATDGYFTLEFRGKHLTASTFKSCSHFLQSVVTRCDSSYF
jgi:hypothetical protein